MDLLEINARILSIKQDHMKHSIKYRKLVKKLISFIDIPEVIFKFIFNYVGSSPFPMNIYMNYKHPKLHPKLRPRFSLKNSLVSHPQALEGTNDQAQ
jgi:hypothetical protein